MQISAKDVEQSLCRMSKGSGAIGTTLKVAAVLWLFSQIFVCILVMVAPCLGGTTEAIITFAFVWNTILYLMLHTIFVIPVWMIANVCRELSQGLSPFRAIQIRRLRIASLCAFAAGFIALIITPGETVATLGNVTIGMRTGQSTFNASFYGTAAVLFLLSFVFEYGVLLQRVSDDTV